jgi:hypothetical protein
VVEEDAADLAGHVCVDDPDVARLRIVKALKQPVLVQRRGPQRLERASPH